MVDNNKLEYPGIDSSWYVYLNFKHYKEELNKLGVQDSIDLSKFLMTKYHIITVAGEHFGDNELTLRFSLIDFDEE